MFQTFQAACSRYVVRPITGRPCLPPIAVTGPILTFFQTCASASGNDPAGGPAVVEGAGNSAQRQRSAGKALASCRPYAVDMAMWMGALQFDLLLGDVH